jgi:MFS superfamily sulfate permease-like transporter
MIFPGGPYTIYFLYTVWKIVKRLPGDEYMIIVAVFYMISKILTEYK